MGELFVWSMERMLILGAVLGVVLWFRKRRAQGYSGAAWRMLWIGFGILLLVPFRLPGISLWELMPEQPQVRDERRVEETQQEKSLAAAAREEKASVPAAEHPEKNGQSTSAPPVTEEQIRKEIRDSLLAGEKKAEPWEILAWVWLFGVGLSALWAAARYIWWRKTVLPWNRRVTDETVLASAEAAARRCGTSVPPLYQNPRLDSPVLFGVLRPVIILPEHEGKAEETAWALLHECVHKRRRDLWIRGLWAVIQWVYWYHPVIYLARTCMAEDLEEACDEAVLKDCTREERQAYGEALLSFARPHRRGTPASAQLAFSMEKERLMRRFQRIFSTEPKKKGRRMLAAFLALGVLTPTLFGCGRTAGEAELEETDQLVICYDASSYSVGLSELYVNNVLSYYRAAHPDVEVILQAAKIGGDSVESQAERKRLKTEIMAGNGPDLLVSTCDALLDNPQKQMESGVFLDVSPYLEKSEEIDRSVLNPQVMECGQADGGQYLIPLSYRVYHMISGKQTLAQYGFQKENCGERKGYLAEVEAFYERTQYRLPLTLAYLDGEGNIYDTYGNSFSALFPDFFSDANGELPFADEDVRKWFALYRQERETLKNHGVADTGYIAEDYLWETGSGIDLLYVADGMLLEEDTPVYLSFQQEKAGATAVVDTWAGILEGAKNKKNAWDFLEMMLSRDIQRLCVKDGQLPVRTDLGEEIMAQMEKADGTWDYWEVKMSDTERQALFTEIVDAMTNVGNAVISENLYDRVLEYFEAYFGGEASYDACAEDAQRYYDIYCSE